jgi:hypothetical protein
MSADTNCESVQESLALYLYGELPFDDEERVDSHLNICAGCRAALERQKALHAALDQFQVQPSATLLRECREGLRARLAQERDEERSTPPARVRWWQGSWLRPVAVAAFCGLIGFFAARLAMPPVTSTDPETSRVRYVEPASGGRVQIVLDETRKRVVSGRPGDRQIRTLLLAAAKDPSDAGLRAETMGILNTDAQSAEVRDALVFTLRHDESADVRLKALEGLKPFAQEPGVRGALEQALLSDSSPGLRSQAIDLLSVSPTGSLDRRIVGTLQELMSREEDSDVRARSQQVLRVMKASVQTY